MVRAHLYLPVFMLLSLAFSTWADDQALQWRYKNAIKIKSQNAQLQIGGRLQWQGAFFNDDVTDIANGTDIRRARLFVKLDIADAWQLKYQYDFKAQESKDAFLKYKKAGPGVLTFGQFKAPFSLENITSSKWTTFIEKAQPNAFSPSRLVGVGYQGKTAHWTYAMAVQGAAIDDDNDGDDPFSWTGRLTFAPIHEKNHSLHFGSSVHFKQLNGSGVEKFSFKTRPEAKIDSTPKLVGAKAQADDYWLANIETAGVWGPFSAQGEFFQVQTQGEQDYSFSGFYLQAGYFFSGESQNYNFSKGAFDKIKPQHKSGAWQVALRYSYIDLTDNNLIGGESENFTLGINYFLNAHFRLSANYIVARIKDGINGDEEIDSGLFRAQWVF